MMYHFLVCVYSVILSIIVDEKSWVFLICIVAINFDLMHLIRMIRGKYRIKKLMSQASKHSRWSGVQERFGSV
jgi:hypothetical protein